MKETMFYIFQFSNSWWQMFAVKNKTKGDNQLKIEATKSYSLKQPITSCVNIKAKAVIISWRLPRFASPQKWKNFSFCSGTQM